MKINEILALIDLYPGDKNYRIKDMVFKDLSKVIKNDADLMALLKIYPGEKNYLIKDYIFANLANRLKNLNDVQNLIKMYPDERNYLIKNFVFANLDHFLKNFDSVRDCIKLYPDENNYLIKDYVFNHLEQYLQNINDVHELIKLYPGEKNYLIKDFIATHPQIFSEKPAPRVEIEQRVAKEQNTRSAQRAQPSSMSDISMQILGGFIAVLGCAAVAIAVTVFNAATFGLGFAVAIGAGMTLSGVGLFSVATYRRYNKVPEEEEEHSASPAYH